MPPMQSTLSETAVKHLTAAQEQADAGNFANAQTHVEQVIAQHPDCDHAHHALGLIAVRADQLPLAAQQFSKAIELNSQVALYQRNYAEVCRRLGRLDEAVQAGRKAIELAPTDLDAQFNLGLALADQSKWAQAIEAYQNALTLNPEHGPAWNNLGVAYERMGQRQEAVLAYTQALRINPGHTEAQLNLGTARKLQGRLNDARQCFNVVRKLAPQMLEQDGGSLDADIAPITPPALYVRDTQSEKGRGVFAARPFAKGELVEASAVVLVPAPCDSIPATLRSYVFNWGVMCGLQNTYALALGYGSLYNHANPASLRYEPQALDLALHFIATRDIAKDEELTINYNTPGGHETGDDNQWFVRMGIAKV